MLAAALMVILASAPPPEGAPPEGPLVATARTAEPVRTISFDTDRFHVVASERAGA
jgi:hypothetical protein